LSDGTGRPLLLFQYFSEMDMKVVDEILESSAALIKNK